MSETPSDKQSLLERIISDEAIEDETFVGTSLSTADLALFSRAGNQLALPEIKNEVLVFNQHPEITSPSINSEYFVDIKTGEISVNQAEIVERGFKEIQQLVQSVLEEPLAKALKIIRPSVWEMFGVQMPSDDDDVLQLRCYWRLTERGVKEIKKFRNKILNLLGLEELKGNGDAILSLFDTIKDSVAFAINVTLTQNETNAEAFTTLPVMEAKQQEANANRETARDQRIDTNIRAAAKKQSAARQAAKKGEHGASRRVVQNEKRLAEGQGMQDLRRLATVRALKDSDAKLPSVKISIHEQEGADFELALDSSLKNILTPEVLTALKKTDFQINAEAHLAYTLLPEDSELIADKFSAYLTFLSTLSANPEDLYPREFVFASLTQDEQKALEAFEQILQFGFAKAQNWEGLVKLQQHINGGSGLGEQQPERPLNHASCISLINQDQEMLNFAIERGLNQNDRTGELIYQSSAQLQASFRKVIQDSSLGVGRKTRIQFCMNALKAGNYNFSELDPWRQIIIDGLQHINALQMLGGIGCKNDIGALMRDLCQYDDKKPSKNERTFIGIIANRFEDDDSFFEETVEHYQRHTKGLSNRGETLS